MEELEGVNSSGGMNYPTYRLIYVSNGVKTTHLNLTEPFTLSLCQLNFYLTVWLLNYSSQDQRVEFPCS